MKTGQSNSSMSGMKFPQILTSQTPWYDGRRKHQKPVKKHRGNLPRPVNYLK
jgi:hypothetical protein